MDVTLVKDREVDPLLVRAYRDGRLCAYAVRDQFGWAIMAPVSSLDYDRSWVRHWAGHSIQTVDRYEPLYPDETSAETRDAALVGLARYAATGRTDVP